MKSKNALHQKIPFTGLLIAMGVVYGDIGTSPLYVMRAIVAGIGGATLLADDVLTPAVTVTTAV